MSEPALLSEADEREIAEALDDLTADNHHTARALIEASMGRTPSVVFVAFTEPDHEGAVLQGVYSNRRKAEAALDALDTSADRFSPYIEPMSLDMGRGPLTRPLNP